MHCSSVWTLQMSEARAAEEPSSRSRATLPTDILNIKDLFQFVTKND